MPSISSGAYPSVVRTESLQNVNLPVAIVLPDPVLRGGDDVAQLLFERDAAAADRRIVERPAHGRHQPRQVGLEHVVVGTALQGIDGALFAERARRGR